MEHTGGEDPMRARPVPLCLFVATPLALVFIAGCSGKGPRPASATGGAAGPTITGGNAGGDSGGGAFGSGGVSSSDAPVSSGGGGAGGETGLGGAAAGGRSSTGGTTATTGNGTAQASRAVARVARLVWVASLRVAFRVPARRSSAPARIVLHPMTAAWMAPLQNVRRSRRSATSPAGKAKTRRLVPSAAGPGKSGTAA
jgi:hypothetical protein